MQPGYRHFLKSLLTVGLTRSILSVSAIVQTVVLASSLSIHAFGLWKMFTLYASFSTVMHFGLLDGAYLRWSRAAEDTPRDILTVLGGLLILYVPILLLGGFSIIWPLDIDGFPLGALLSFVVIYNISVAFIFELQSLRKFGWSSGVQLVMQLGFLVGVFLMIQTDLFTYMAIVELWIFCAALPAIIRAMQLRRRLFSSPLTIPTILSATRSDLTRGMPILLTNLAWLGINTADRVLVNLTSDLETFAQYSFAISMLAIVISLINAAGDVLLPYLAHATQKMREKGYWLATAVLMVGWGSSLSLMFILDWFVAYWLPQYQPSFSVLYILALGLGFAATIRILHIPYLVAAERQTLSLLSQANGAVALVLIVGGTGLITANIHWIAAAKVLVLMLIYIWNALHFMRKIELSTSGVWRTLIYALSCAGVLSVINSLVPGRLVAAGLYLTLVTIVSLCLYGDQLRAAWRLTLGQAMMTFHKA